MADAQLKAVITAEDKASKVIANVGGSLDKVKGKLQAMQPAFKSMAVAGATGFAAVSSVLYASVKAFGDAEVKLASLDATLKAIHATAGETLPTFEEARKAILATGAAAIQLGFDDEEAEKSMALLYARTHDLTQAHKLQALAMDLARAKGLDLETSTKLITLALSGQGRALLQYGIMIKDSATPLEALGVLQEKVGGQAVAFAGTLAGKSEILKETFSNLEENIGQALAPALEQLAAKITPIIEKIAEWISKHPQLAAGILAAAAGISGLVLVVGSLGLLLPGLITALSVLGTVLAFIAANPIVLLIAALVLMALKVKDAMDAVGGAKEFFRQTWDGIKIIFSEAIDSIIAFFQPLIDKINQVKNALSSIGSAIGSAGRSVGNAISNVVGRASGGAVSPMRSFIVGENGPELFTPSTYGSISGAGSGSIVINLTGNTFLGREGIAEQIGKE